MKRPMSTCLFPVHFGQPFHLVWSLVRVSFGTVYCVRHVLCISSAKCLNLYYPSLYQRLFSGKVSLSTFGIIHIQCRNYCPYCPQRLFCGEAEGIILWNSLRLSGKRVKGNANYFPLSPQPRVGIVLAISLSRRNSRQTNVTSFLSLPRRRHT